MKTLRRVIALAALTAALPVAAAHAQSFENNTKLGFFGGASIPTGDMSNGVSTGFNLGALVEMRPSLSPIAVRAEGAYNRFGFKNGGGNSAIWSLTGNAVLSPPTSPLYLIGGLGVYNISDNYDSNFSGSQATVSSGTQLGFNVGAGLRIPLTGFDTFLEARWNTVSTGGNGARANFIPVSFGVKF